MKRLSLVSCLFLAVCLLFQVCIASPVSATTAKKAPTVALTWYIGGSTPNNLAAVLKQANVLIKSKINATLNLKITDFGDYQTKMQLIMASGQNYDLAYTSSWVNNFSTNVSNGAYIPLDSYLAKYPALKSIMPQTFWNAAKVNGKQYAVPNLQLEYSQNGLAFNKSLVDKYGIDLSSITQMSDLTPIFAKVHAADPSIIEASSTDIFAYGYIAGNISRTSLFSTSSPLPIDVNTTTWKVVDDNKVQQMVDYYDIVRQWNQDGFFPADAATLTDPTSLDKTGKVLCQYTTCKPGGDAESSNTLGYTVESIPTMPMVFTQDSVIAALTAISRTSKHPATAFALINLVNTNKDLINMLSFGLKGEDYTLNSATSITPKKNAYNMYNWELGDVFNSYLIPGQAANTWTQTKKNNENAISDPLNGFQINTSSIKSQLASCDAVAQKYHLILTWGLEDPTTAIASYEADLKASGFNDIMAAVQSQLNTWVAKNK
jgi:putative aldouronate transport system substrate-binding protein